MSLPTYLRIKRKATDEPVDLLRVEEEHLGVKKRRADGFVFRLQPNTNPISIDSPANDPSRKLKNVGASWANRKPQVESLQADETRNASLPGQGHQVIPPTGFANCTIAHGGQNVQGDRDPTGSQPEPAFQSTARPSQVPRRFHLARDRANDRTRGHGVEKTRDRKHVPRYAPAVFMEQTQGHRTVNREVLHNTLKTKGEENHGPGEDGRVSGTAGLGRTNDTDQNIETRKEQSSNTPGSSGQRLTHFPARNVRLASGRVIPWNVDSETLAEEMQAYTMQEIGRNLAQASQTSPFDNPSLHSTAPRARGISSHAGFGGKYKPKKPVRRNQTQTSKPDVGPEHASSQDTTDLTEPSEDIDMDEADYVTDTYIRVPVEAIADSEIGTMGLLCLETEEDAIEFYGDDDSDSDVIYDEEEDENAEDHPSHDYPEDEIDSEDEYDREAYRFRNGNASDLEEFDLNDYDDEANFSDDESAYPWSRKPWDRKLESKILSGGSALAGHDPLNKYEAGTGNDESDSDEEMQG